VKLLGRGPGSLLSRRLRLRDSLAYTASAQAAVWRTHGLLTVRTTVAAAVAPAAVRHCRGLLQIRLETASQICEDLACLIARGLPLDHYRRLDSQLGRVTPNDVLDFAERRLGGETVHSSGSVDSSSLIKDIAS